MTDRADIEQALIALALLDNAVADLLVPIPEDYFSNYVFRQVLSILKEKRARGEVCDVFTVASMLDVRERQVVVDAVATGLASLDGQAKEALAKNYIKLLQKRKIAQDLAVSFKEFAQQLTAKPFELDGILLQAQQAIGEALARYQTDDQQLPTPLEDLRPLFVQGQSIKTGIWELDRALRSTMPGDLFVVAGRTSVGKTAFAIQLAIQSAIMGKKVLYVSLEMRKSEIFARFLSHLGFIPVGWFFSPRESMLKPLAVALNRFRLLPIQIIDSSAYSSAFDTPQLAIALQTHAPDIAIVDYLHLMASAKEDGMVVALSELSRELKQLALRQQCIIVGLSQINRTADASDADIEQLYYSSALGHTASQVLMLRPKKENKEKEAELKFRFIELALVKNRNGPTCRVRSIFYPSVMRFVAESFKASQE